MAGDDQQPEIDGGFQWDENSQLYYHASTGFYHDPSAGWYYSSIDGLYYKFEDGNYVLLDSNQSGEEMHNNNGQGETSGAQMVEKEVPIKTSLDSSACNGSNESDYPPPPSEWLEDTLIEMYLSGYPSKAMEDTTTPVETNGTNIPSAPQPVVEYDDIDELEEGEWIPDDPEFWKNFSDKIVEEGISEEEENWRAQYGQVIEVSQSDKELMSGVQMVDLWDWALVKGTKKDGKTEVFRLVGRLRKRSSKLHPSVPSGSGTLKTAPVCEAHLDMVRVTSGRIYRLRSPSLKYLASSSVHDASNPTKDWGFPQLSIKNHIDKLQKSDVQSESRSFEGPDDCEDKTSSSVKISLSKNEHIYRDRAAERRALHGGFGVGPGQKNSHSSHDSAPSPPTLPPEVAAAESLSMSFGAGSYARRILEGMGWKEGETLGHSSTTGLTEPLQATGNKGTAGLGWDDPRRKYIAE